jgi:hypothetical protein
MALRIKSRQIPIPLRPLRPLREIQTRRSTPGTSGGTVPKTQRRRNIAAILSRVPRVQDVSAYSPDSIEDFHRHFENA